MYTGLPKENENLEGLYGIYNEQLACNQTLLHTIHIKNVWFVINLIIFMQKNKDQLKAKYGFKGEDPLKWELMWRVSLIYWIYPLIFLQNISVNISTEYIC